MKMRKQQILIPLILVISIAVVTVGVTPTTAQPQTTISPSPKGTCVMDYPGLEFTVNITVSNVQNLNLYQVGLTFNQSILEATSFVAGDFFLQAPEEYRSEPVNQPWGENNIDPGICHIVAWALKKPGNVSGTGTLAVATFKVIASGVSSLNITMSGVEVALLGYVNGNLISFDAINGSVTVTPECIDHTVVLGDETFHVVTFSNSCISDLGVNPLEKKINFTATGTGTSFCNITIPKNLLNASQEDWTISIDGESPLIAPFISENATHTMINLVYSHGSTVTIEIMGTWMVPESSTIVFLLMLMIATLVVVILGKSIKRREKTNGK